MTRALLALLLLIAAFVPAPASAQALLGGDDGKPLEIYADDGIEWRREERVYIAHGNAKAIKEDTEIRANELRAYYSGSGDGSGDIYKVEAIGAVVITSPDGKAYGDRGVYDVKSQVMVLTGKDLKLLTKGDTVTARDSLEYWQAKGLAVARGAAQVIRVDPQKNTKNVLRADVMTATFMQIAGKQEMRVVDAYDNVEIITPCDYVSGDRGRYLVQEQIALVTGNVKITSGNNQLNGDEAEVNLVTGISTLKGDRVKGLLIPNKDGDKKAPDGGKTEDPKKNDDQKQPLPGSCG